MDKRRKWISILIEEGLQVGVLHPTDLLRHLTPAVLATDLPPALVAAILQSGIDNITFDPELIVKTLGSDNIAEHLPLPLLWNCINEAAYTIIQEHPHGPSAIPADETVGPEVVEPLKAEEMPEIEVLDD